ncbi:glutathione synthase [Sphaeroforma arctica JP610]|uniref:Glutathione synthetase n=1 Tax=Sphaeroforma arctica JP610 TaxID=667725 RepID=A0A0L0FT98_9EUKA|nr:glutathione synthase [Sphaeroforma arctica JP610]KNC80007.1 glutathione synthase [Sphaeroforma arctica JP610]|eukprot:XP_014153909.1 glutathione synthase [Sphaeroforma arctica JP610]
MMERKENIPAIDQATINQTGEWELMHGVALRNADGTARHCPYSIAPVTLERTTYEKLVRVTPLISKLIHGVSEDQAFLEENVTGAALADPFFGRLLKINKQIMANNPARLPLLIIRTDYMDDRNQGARVIEFNGIAAGMAPFGQRVHEFHRYVQMQWPEVFSRWVAADNGELAVNKGLDNLAKGIADTAFEVRSRSDDKGKGKPVFIMVVQEDEDNVYDQHLLEMKLLDLGVRPVRRTFDQLSKELSTGPNQRLILKDIGGVDVVYLRVGYQCIDYFIPGEPECCSALINTRAYIEKHRVAMNATVSQQLATSKTIQMVITNMSAKQLSRWGLTEAEGVEVLSVLAEMKPIDANTATWLRDHADVHDWVLKNQGEGGGHCVFGSDIFTKLAELKPDKYKAWALMLRLFPHERERPALAVRDNKASVVEDLISEIGLFTVHFEGKPMAGDDGYAGYLIRSKPAQENEGGVHTGKGVLDSILLIN